MGLVAVAGIAMVAALAVGYATSSGAMSVSNAVSGLTFLGSLLAFILSGAIIVARRPGNVIGVLLIVPGLTAPAASLISNGLAAIEPPPTQLTPLLWLLGWWSSWTWVLLIFPIFHLLLVLPTGRLLSSRWRLAVALEGAMVGTMIVLATFSEQVGAVVDGNVVWALPNPIGVFPQGAEDAVFGAFWGAGLLSITILSACALLLRFRRGTTDEREQLKWPMFGALLFGLIYAGGVLESAVTGGSVVGGPLFGLGLAAIPVTVAIAVLRYRLYEIDRIVSRTIGWALVTGILVSIFVLLVVGLQAMVVGVTQGETLAVAISTLVAFTLFQPVRRRVQRAVDLRFNRAHYDAKATTDRFATQLRSTVDLAAVHQELVGTVGRAFEPRAAGVWIRTQASRGGRR